MPDGAAVLRRDFAEREQERIRFAIERPYMKRVMAHPMSEDERTTESFRHLSRALVVTFRDFGSVTSRFSDALLPRPARGPFMAIKVDQ